MKSPKNLPPPPGFWRLFFREPGHLYSERYRDAAVAFVLNGAFIWGMVEAFQHKNYAVGGILTFFELGWYSGNIYSAVSSAHKYNRNKKKEYLDIWKRKDLFSLGISFRDKYPVACFPVCFLNRIFFFFILMGLLSQTRRDMPERAGGRSPGGSRPRPPGSAAGDRSSAIPGAESGGRADSIFPKVHQPG